MRIRSEGTIPSFDLAVLHRFIPALWAEWDALHFAPDGLLLDPATGESVGVLRLTDGRHRRAGARYTLPADRAAQYSFTLADDDGRTVRGTLVGPPGSSVRIAIGQHLSASGHGIVVPTGGPFSLSSGPLAGAQWTVEVTTGDRWSADGQAGLVGDGWSAGLTLGARWHLTVRIEVRKLLRANDVPGYLITLIGGREAIVDLEIDPSVIDRHGELLSGRVRVQRASVDGVLDVRAKRDAWHCQVKLHLHGRGLLGRSALLGARPVVRRAVRDGFTDFWADLASQATDFKNTLAELDRETAAPGGPAERLHRDLWESIREGERDHRAAAAAQLAEIQESERVGSAATTRPFRQRHAVAIALGIVLLALIIAVVVALVDKGSSDSSSGPDRTPAPEQPTVSAFALFHSAGS